MIKNMKATAEEDRELNMRRQPAVKKLCLLPEVQSHLKKTDLQEAFIEQGILAGVTVRFSEGTTPRRDIDKALTGEEKSLRPGEKGFVNRARVPMPSVKDYVVRPTWNVDEAPKAQSKKKVTKYEKHVRSFAEKKKNTKAQRAITISIEGRNMAL
ncbi:hypothetical protein ScPMuIL_018152 [Solemya velum]